MADIACSFKGCKKPYGVPKIGIRLKDINLNNLQKIISPGDLVCVRHFVPGSKEQVKCFLQTGYLLPSARLDSSLTKSQRSSHRTSDSPQYQATAAMALQDHSYCKVR